MSITTEVHPIPREQIEAYKMNWSGLYNGKRTPDQRLLDELTANFMLSPFGRPGNLFEDSSTTARKAWLDKAKFSGLTASRENHKYLAGIATYLSDNRFEDFDGINQVISLITDFDLVAQREKNSPYIDHYEGSWKIDHPDFHAMRQSLASYLEASIIDSNFRQKVIRSLRKKNAPRQDDIFYRMKLVSEGICVAKYLPDQTPEEAVQKLEDPNFRTRVVNNKYIFNRKSVWKEEKWAIRSSHAAERILGNTKSRYQAAVAHMLEKRTGKWIDLYSRYDNMIKTLAAGVNKLATECGYASNDADFDLLTFTDICLEKMGVAEKLTKAPYPSDEKMFDRITASLEEIAKDKKMSDVENQLKQEPISPRKNSWQEEVKRIKVHPKAVRELILGGSRIKALMIAALEDIKTEGDLDLNQLAVARKLAEAITPVIENCGYKPLGVDVDMETVIAKAVGLMKIPNILELLTLRNELKNWQEPRRLPIETRISQVLEKIEDYRNQPTRIPLTESIDSFAKALAMVLENQALPEETKTWLAKRLEYSESKSRLRQLEFLRWLHHPRFEKALAAQLSRPTEKLPSDDQAYAEMFNDHIVTSLYHIATNTNLIDQNALRLIIHDYNNIKRALLSVLNKDTRGLNQSFDSSRGLTSSPHECAIRSMEHVAYIFKRLGIDKGGYIIDHSYTSPDSYKYQIPREAETVHASDTKIASKI